MYAWMRWCHWDGSHMYRKPMGAFSCISWGSTWYLNRKTCCEKTCTSSIRILVLPKIEEKSRNLRSSNLTDHGRGQVQPVLSTFQKMPAICPVFLDEIYFISIKISPSSSSSSSSTSSQSVSTLLPTSPILLYDVKGNDIQWSPILALWWKICVANCFLPFCVDSPLITHVFILGVVHFGGTSEELWLGLLSCDVV